MARRGPKLAPGGRGTRVESPKEGRGGDNEARRKRKGKRGHWQPGREPQNTRRRTSGKRKAGEGGRKRAAQSSDVV